MKKLYTIMSLTLILIATAARAQDCLYLGYCGNQISDNPQVKTGSNKDIEAAICLTPEMLAAYVGCQISGVQVGFPQGSQLPQHIAAWARVGSKTADNIAQSDSTATEKGWVSVPFAEPYTVTGAEGGLYVGFRYHQSSAVRCLSFVGEPNDNGALLCTYTPQADGTMKTAWSNVSKVMKGCLSLRAIVTGDIPHHDLALKNVSAQAPVLKTGKDIIVSGTVVNLAADTASRPVITYQRDGQPAATYTLRGDLPYEGTEDFRLVIPTADLTGDHTLNISLQLDWADASIDENPADNQQTVVVELQENPYTKKMVVEEATGTWCGWCVRGYVGLKKMAAKYPESFIGIGVHNGDEFVYAPYDRWITTAGITGYPGALVNRNGNVYDPSFQELEQAYKAMDPVSCARLDLEGQLDGNLLTMKATSKFSADIDHEVRLAFVVLEDSVMTTQTNYYSDGDKGPMDGFEHLDSHCEIPMMEAARYISNTTGDPSSVSNAPRKGQAYDYTATIDLTTIGTNQVVDTKNIHLVAILIDTKTREILNGEKAPITFADGIRAIDIDHTPATPRPVYNIQGQRLTRPQKGLNIIGGHKVIVK